VKAAADLENVARGTSPAVFQTVTLKLPYPVSANRYWQSFVPKGSQRPIVHLSSEAKAYKHEAGWLAKCAGVRKPTTVPLELAFVLHPPATVLRRNGDATTTEVRCGTRMDLDNCLKVAIDALKGIAYKDDSQVERIRAEYGERRGHGELVVEIAEFVPAAPPLFAEAAA
jgi:crossover junction endodeoxyribonuclease RusA